PGELEGIASGTSNALRQVGTVLGIAVLGSVFSATGGLDSPVQFTAGLTNALVVSAAILAVAAPVGMLAPREAWTPPDSLGEPGGSGGRLKVLAVAEPRAES